MAHEETNPNEPRQQAPDGGLGQALADAVREATRVQQDGGILTAAVRDAVARAGTSARERGIPPAQLLAALDAEMARAPEADGELRGLLAALLLRAHVGDGDA